MACDFWAKGLNRNSLDATGLSPPLFRCPPISTRVVETFGRRVQIPAVHEGVLQPFDCERELFCPRFEEIVLNLRVEVRVNDRAIGSQCLQVDGMR
jgi:hypothetical protein